MKFLIDENLPSELADIFTREGVRCFHINRIKKDDRERIPDSILRKYAIYRDYIIVTKDFDFVNSWRSRKVPDKMIFVHHQDSKAELIRIFKHHIREILKLLKKYDFLELSKKGIRLPFEKME